MSKHYLQEQITASGILKGNGSGGVSAAVAGTDFAPAGYGLGSVSTPLTASDDLDSVYQNGWYQWGGAAPQNAPFPYCSMLVVSINPSDVDQIVFEHNTLRRIVLRRRITNWESWEHVNPPMQIGVEYRTTERFMGKPVYVKVVDCGYLPNATNKTVAYSDDTNCRPIWGCGHTGTSTFPSLNFGSTMATSLATADNVSLWILNNNISIACGGNRSTIRAYVIVKYYKTTD